jgi:hypothetical protein
VRVAVGGDVADLIHGAKLLPNLREYIIEGGLGCIKIGGSAQT